MGGRHLVFDIETKMKHAELRKDSHILEQVDNEVLSLCIMDLNSRTRHSFTDSSDDYPGIQEGLSLLAGAERIIGHNICGFDLAAIEDIYPSFTTKADLFDTMLMSQLIFPELFLNDLKRKNFPKELNGRHSLKAWGTRLTNYKTDYQGDFLSWSKDMQDYCEQDVDVTASLYTHLFCRNYSEQAIILEGKFLRIITQQERNGVHFDREASLSLYNDIEEELTPLLCRIKAEIPDWTTREEFTPKVNNKARGYIKGETVIRESVIPFNPNSRQQIVKYFQENYSWRPKVFTKSGAPQINHEVMDSLPFPEAQILSEFLVRKALMSKIKDAKGGWSNIVREGKLHGRVNTLGTRTRRCSHSAPNLGQIPSVGKYMGERCRELFFAPKGYKIVGCDQSAIQLRVLAHYMAAYDGGAYAEIVLNGDIHSANQEAAGLPTRPDAKRFIYAFLFGAGDELLGGQLEPHANSDRKKRLGGDLRAKFLNRTHGLNRLLSDVERAHKRGYVKLIDGGIVISPSSHTALNTLLQGTDAVVCKQWNIIAWEKLIASGLDKHCKQILSVHDEFQMLVKDEYAESVGEILAVAAKEAGEVLGLRIPTAGEYKIGDNWLETH